MTAHEASPTHETTASGMHQPEHDALLVWLRLLSCSTLMENQISSRLRSTFDTTLPRFDLMAQLARFPDGITMGEVSQRLMVSGGNVTGITDHLEEDGLVERVALPGDRRAKLLRLTDQGRVVFDQMATVHARWIGAWIGGLTEQEQQHLYTLLGKLKQHVSTSLE